MKQKLTLQNLYILFFCLHVLMIVAGGFCVKENIFNPAEDKAYAEIDPAECRRIDDDTWQYTLEVSSDGTDNYLMFDAGHQEVWVYADGELIFERRKINSVFGHTPGSSLNIVCFPSDANKIEIQLKAVYKSGRENSHTFYQGNGVAMFRGVIRNSLASVCVSMLLIVLGLFMVACWIIFCYKTGLAKELLYMGIFVMLIGCWAFGEAGAVRLVFDNRAYASYITFSFLMLMGITFMLFLKNYLKTQDRYIHKILALYSFCGMALMIVLQALDIADLKETIIIIHIALVCDLLYLLYIIVDKMRRKKDVKNVVLNIAGLVDLTVIVAFELYAYYAHFTNIQVFAMLGLLVYIAILAMEIGTDTSKKVGQLRKAEIYKELAQKDILTKCFNRNSYNEDIKQSFSGDTYVVMFDLNNLKKCNDTLGHMEGDRYLTDSAELIKKVFAKYGKVYRIGGDEFCIIMKYASEDMIRPLIQQLIREEDAYNRQSKTVCMQIATGYARYDGTLDASLEQTRGRADMLMYENKKKIKKNGSN